MTEYISPNINISIFGDTIVKSINSAMCFKSDTEAKYLKLHKTRLFGRPQPQMYPPVALNQHTLVNRTHKHYIYIHASRPHKHLKITPKLNNM